MEVLAIPAHGSDRLVLSAESQYLWLAALEVGGLRAAAHVENGPAHMTGMTIADLFAEMAECWRGWTGKRTWSNNEGTLELTATHDRLGHIALEVQIRHWVDPRWEATGTLQLDAGQLAGLAHDAQAFDHSQAGTDGRSPGRTPRLEYLKGWDSDGRALP